MQIDDENEPKDLFLDAPRKDAIDRPKKLQSLIDTQAMRFLEGLDFGSFNNLSGAYEQFMMEAPLFQADASFGAAAMALDLTAQLFSTIDTDKDSLLSREEFAYLLMKTTADNRAILAWLTENFNAFTQATFFKDQIGKDDIEAARHVFHGLKFAQDKFGFNKQPNRENLANLDPDKLQDYIDKNGTTMNANELAGVKYLIDHIRKHVDPRSKKDAALIANDKLGQKPETQANKQLNVLEGILDDKSMKTLRGLELNNFESLLLAFAEFLEAPDKFRGNNSFDKAGSALLSTAGGVDGLDMGAEHMFTRDELRIVSKMTTSPDKAQIGWVAKHFDALGKIFSFSGKAKKKKFVDVAEIFDGLSFVRGEVIEHASNRDQLAAMIRNHLASIQGMPQHPRRKSLESLVQFLEQRV